VTRIFRGHKTQWQYHSYSKTKEALDVEVVDNDTRSIMIDLVLGAANDTFNAIHTPGIALEDRVGVIFGEMSQDRKHWNSDHLDAVLHVMTRLEEIRKVYEA
jgi:hypothetical protein